MDWNRWLLRLALMSLFAVFVSACTELTSSGSSEYIIQTPGSTCLPGDIGAHNPCAAPAGCTVTEQYCDPLNGNTWTQCGSYDGCALGSPSSTATDGGSCTDGAYVFCSVGGSGGPLGIMTCSGGVFSPCGMLGSGFDAGVVPMDGSVSCGGDLLIGAECDYGSGVCDVPAHYQCVSGTRSCVPDSLPAPVPSTETCNNLDDDCDGSVDETVTRTCYSGPDGTASVGECRYGTQTCTAGSWATTCSGEVLPSTDAPDNGLDEDCNGADMGSVECGEDPRIDRSCTVGLGECVASGVYTCDTPTGTIGCSAVTDPAATELCDDLDNDCDGTIDDGVVRSCYTGPAGTDGVGICHHGYEFCSVGVGDPQWSACAGEQTPITEIPDNGIDEDCSGSDLESVDCGGDMTVGTPCVTGLGACRADGFLVCEGGLLRCDAEALPPTSETCNGLDDDCDGFADDSVVRSCYTGPSGTAGVGICLPGTQTCIAGSFGACTGEVLPTTEVAGDGLDQDCSGGDLTVGPCGGSDTIGDACSVGLGECEDDGVVVCSGSSLDCTATPGTPVTETCNGLDDDCNDVVDNGTNVTCYTGPTGTAGVGVCRAGLRICSGGILGTTCSGQVLPSTEVCGNATDEDCNGVASPCPPPPPVDAGVDSGPPMMSDAGVDSGAMMSDAGSSSDGGTGGSTPESVQRNLCRDARPSSLTGTMTLAYDQACLNALMGTCASGWITILYDQNGCEVPSDPGASLTVDRLHRLGGRYDAGLRCGTTYRPWPADARNDIVNTACVPSILFNGDQLADAESRICPAISDGVSLVPAIPGHPSVTISCP